MQPARLPADLSDAAFAIRVDGGALSVHTAGKGFPILFLHGWTLDNRMWAPQRAELADVAHLIFPDRRGFGRSTAPPNLCREAADIIAIADAFDLPLFGLVGLSQGAAIALDCAIRHSDRIAGVVLAGTPLPGLVPEPDTPPREAYAAMIRQGDLSGMLTAWLRHPLMQLSDPELLPAVVNILSDYDGRDLLQPSALPPFDIDKIAALPMPLLALAGSTETAWRIACSQLLGKTAQHGQFAQIAGASHLINMEQPSQFNTKLRDFFRPFLSLAR